MSLHLSPDADAVASTVAGDLLRLLGALQAQGRRPRIALTGGSIAERIHRATARMSADTVVDWTGVEVFWGDERFVAPGSEDRNALQARRDLLDPVGASRVHEIPGTDRADTPDEAARQYADVLREHNAGGFDLVMLGLGEDGHVASLMPHQESLTVTDRLTVGVTGSPKPPPERVSLTFAALSRTDRLWFVVSGAGKADAVARATAPEGDVADTPARGIRVPDAVWYVDQAAAALA